MDDIADQLARLSPNAQALLQQRAATPATITVPTPTPTGGEGSPSPHGRDNAPSEHGVKGAQHPAGTPEAPLTPSAAGATTVQPPWPDWAARRRPGIQIPLWVERAVITSTGTASLQLDSTHRLDVRLDTPVSQPRRPTLAARDATLTVCIDPATHRVVLLNRLQLSKVFAPKPTGPNATALHVDAGLQGAIVGELTPRIIRGEHIRHTDGRLLWDGIVDFVAADVPAVIDGHPTTRFACQIVSDDPTTEDQIDRWQLQLVLWRRFSHRSVTWMAP